MMSDEEAVRYIDHLRKFQKGLPKSQYEYKYLEMFDASTNAFTDTYGYFAADLAQQWNKKYPRIPLGRCIRVANTGLIMARAVYLIKKPDIPFIEFAKPFIKIELKRTIEKTD